MFFRSSLAMILAAALVVAPASRAAADVHGAVGAAILLNLLGGGKAKPKPSPGISSAQRQQNRNVQTALNYFNYPAGVVDGIMGSGTRGAIRSFEAAMGFPVDGRLDDYEREFLLGSLQRAQTSSGVQPYNQILASQGRQGLLQTYNNERRGIVTPNPNAPRQAVAPTPAPSQLPVFGENAAPQTATIGDYCNSISVITTTNGGFTTIGTLGDKEFALDEQFCLVRTAATAEAERAAANMSNVTEAQLISQCDGLGAFMQPMLAKLQESDPTVVSSQVEATLRGSGQSMQQLSRAGVVCLGLGYRQDKAPVALASALLMVGAGHSAYGEIVSHHLRRGFGTVVNQSRSSEWMNATITAMEGGATPAFLPNRSSDRMALLSVASRGQTDPSGAGLPTFGSGN